MNIFKPTSANKGELIKVYRGAPKPVAGMQSGAEKGNGPHEETTTRIVNIPHHALFLSLFTDRDVLLYLAGYECHTMPEFTWDHLNYPQG